MGSLSVVCVHVLSHSQAVNVNASGGKVCLHAFGTTAVLVPEKIGIVIIEDDA